VRATLTSRSSNSLEKGKKYTVDNKDERSLHRTRENLFLTNLSANERTQKEHRRRRDSVVMSLNYEQGFVAVSENKEQEQSKRKAHRT
jgi:uncharacterized membrane protein YfhO